MVLPDNVLFEGGAGENPPTPAGQVRFPHLLRLPTGIFYKQGVKANVYSSTASPPAEKPWTKELWIYDFRTNQSFTLKKGPLKRADLDDFVVCYSRGRRQERIEINASTVRYDGLVNSATSSISTSSGSRTTAWTTGPTAAAGVIAAEIVESLEAATLTVSAM